MQLELLATHRQRLAVLLAQYAHFGPHVAPHILTDIRTTQEALRPIKAWLRASGVPIEDEPNDDVQVMIDPAPSHLSNNPPIQPINNPASNQGAQGNFYGSVSFHQAGPSSPASPAFQVPYPQSTLFVGREHELEHLAALLDNNDTIAVVPAIAGTGGIGKTMLAAEFAHHYQKRFPGGVFWLNMEDPEGVESQIAACAGPGGLQLAGYVAWSFEDRKAATLAVWQQPDRRLLIFDNLEDPKLLRWRPTSGGSCVLITTRRAKWTARSGVHAIPLDTLARPDSLSLLLTPRYGSDFPDDPAADAICEALGDLPLALTLAGAYLEHYPSVTLTAYQAQITRNLVSDESLNAVLEEGLPTRHASSIVATFALSYERLKSHDPIDTLARTLLYRAACCAPIAIPRALMDYTKAAEQEAMIYQRDVDAALHRLLAVGLLDDMGSAGVRLHRLLAAFARSVTPDPNQEQQWVSTALANLLYDILVAGYPMAGLPYLEHARHSISSAAEDITQAHLLNNLGYLLNSLGELVTARLHYERALTIREKSLGLSHPDTVHSLNNLGTLLCSLGELVAARPYLERALAIREQTLGSSHLDTARSLNNLGLLFKEMGELAAARSYYERALAIQEQSLGSSHPDTVRSLNNLGALLYSLGELAAARHYFERALAIREQTLGPSHPDTALGLNNLGLLLKEMGELAAARPYYERALTIQEQSLGLSHPNTAASLNNLGALLSSLGELAAARPYFERALAICEQTLGPSHPDTATSLNNLGYLLQEMGELATAQPCYQRALDINEHVLGSDHPDTATSLNNLGYLFQKMGELATAQSYYQRALEVRERVLGPNHPNTITSLNNTGGILKEMGDLAVARPYFERALSISEHTLGSNHPLTNTIRENLKDLDTILNPP